MANLNRRKFLKQSASLGSALLTFPYIIRSSALGADAPSNRIVMGAIGVGSMGMGDLHAFLGKREVQMVAVCDVDARHRNGAKEAVDRAYGNNDCKAYLDFRELLGRGDLDAVMLALPDHWHGIISVESVKAGLHVHGQKPLARTIKEGRAISDAVKRYNVIWQTGSQQRSDWQFHRACELVINGRIGKVNYVEVGLPNGGQGPVRNIEAVPDGLDWDFWLGPAPAVPFRGVCHWDWRWIRDYSGGQLTDWIGHHLDIAHWGLGLDRTGPVEIEGRGVFPKDGIFDTAMEYRIICKYANGVEILIANESQQPKRMGTVWYGDKGWIYVDRAGLWASDEKILKETIGPEEIHLYNNRDHKQNFLDCIKTGRETICPAEIAHRSVSVGLLGEIAMLTERKLKWDPEKEIFIGEDNANRFLSRAMRSPWHI